MKNAANQLWETCTWRKEFGTNGKLFSIHVKSCFIDLSFYFTDITADNINQEYRDAGLYYSRGKDRDGKKIFFFNCRLYVRGSRNLDELKRVLVYWIERTFRENDNDLITPIFDMSNCGLSNVDLGYLQYIINLFKQYYPDSINYIVVYDMAWILNGKTF